MSIFGLIAVNCLKFVLLFYLFLIVLCGLFHKTIQKKYLLGFNEILVVNGKEDYSILIAYRYTQLIEIGIYKFLYHLVFTTFTSAKMFIAYLTLF